MKREILVVYDVVHDYALPPIVVEELSPAIRHFYDMANNPEQQIGFSPRDYRLLHLGTLEVDDISNVNFKKEVTVLATGEQIEAKV